MVQGKVELDGVTISYEVSGEGPPLLLIAGLGCGLWSWYKQVPVFSQRFQVIAVNNRGMDDWKEASPSFTLRTMVDDCLAVLRAVGVERTHVLGFSMGGYIAQEMAVYYPEFVNRLVLQSTAFFGPSTVPVTAEALEFFSSYGQIPVDEHIERGSHMRFSEDFIRRCPEQVKEFAELYKRNAPTRAGYQAQVQAVMTFWNEDHVGSIRAPTLVLAGSGDRIIPPENSRLLAKKIPSAMLHIFEGAGHWINVECAEQFNQIVTEFLAESAGRK